jgi:hypothetical protein
VHAIAAKHACFDAIGTAIGTNESSRWLHIKAGVPDGAAVDLSLVKLPADALVFPAPPARGEEFSFSKLRDPRAVSRLFKRRAASSGSRSCN